MARYYARTCLARADADATLAAMESAPSFDASRPSNLRLAAFAFTAVGALLLGLGSIMTWVTYGIRFPGDVPTVVPGTDDVAGRIVLVCAALVLVAVIASRVISVRGRRLLALSITVAGGAAVGVSVWFVVTVADRYAAIQADPGRTSAPVASYADLGPGPWVAIVGGLLALAGGILTYRWATRVMRNPGPLPPH